MRAAVDQSLLRTRHTLRTSGNESLCLSSSLSALRQFQFAIMISGDVVKMRTKRMEAKRLKPLDLHWLQQDASAAQSVNEPLSPLSELVTSMTEMNAASKGDGSLQRRSSDPLELCIFLPNRQGIQFTVAEGRYANADQLTTLLWAEMELEKERAQKTLALWMCSPLLSIQLKEHHVPFKLRKLWPHLLRRYTSASEEQIFQDEPLLMVRRNVMLTIDDEMQLEREEEEILEMLYLDAKDYTLSGYRPLPVDHCIRLAAIQMAIEWGPLDSNIHTLTLIRDAIEDFFPEHVLPSVRGWSLFGWTISGCAGAEAAIMEQYEEMSALSKNELQKRYLQLSRQHPGYGSAVFFGLIEQRGRWWRTRHVPVIVTINSCWLCIIDESSRVPLLTINIGTMKWCSLEGSQNNDPLLVLLFPLNDRTQLNNMIAITSKQTPLMEALLDSVTTAQEGQSSSFRHLDETFENFFENRTDMLVSALFDIRQGVCLEMPDGLRSRWMQNVDYSRERNDYPMEHCLA